MTELTVDQRTKMIREGWAGLFVDHEPALTLFDEWLAEVAAAARSGRRTVRPDEIEDLFALDQNDGGEVVVLDRDGRAWIIAPIYGNNLLGIDFRNERLILWELAKLHGPLVLLSPAEPAKAPDLASFSAAVVGCIERDDSMLETYEAVLALFGMEKP